MTSSPLPSLVDVLGTVPDHRRHNRVHPLPAILAMSVCAMLCGARSLYAIFQWGRENADLITPIFGFRDNRTPCHASLHYVFGSLDATAFESVLGSWFWQQVPRKTLQAVSMDGKFLKGIHGERIAGVHLVSAFAHHLGLPMGQTWIGNNECELIGARRLLEVLDLKGVILTGDSLYCQRDICTTMVEKGGTTSSSSRPTSPLSLPT
jgi:hypothetical protein